MSLFLLSQKFIISLNFNEGNENKYLVVNLIYRWKKCLKQWQKWFMIILLFYSQNLIVATQKMHTQQRRIRKPLSVVTNIQTESKKVRQPKRIIKFIGDMAQNIENIVEQISCTCGCTEFKEILLIFGEKIEKLRNQRDMYKNKYFNDVEKLRNQIKKMEQQIISVFKDDSQKTLNHLSSIKTQEHNVTNSLQNTENEQIPNQNNLKLNLNEGTYLRNQTSLVDDDEDQEREEHNGLSKIYDSEGIQRLMKKYNVGLDELEDLMREYITEQQAYFDSQEQRKLYKLSRKLEKNIWIKKVKSDLQVLESARSRAGNK